MSRQDTRTPRSRHDRGYKFLFASKKIFLDLLRCFVRCGWVDRIDSEDALEPVNKSYVLPDFSGKEADVVYKVRLKGRTVFFLLLELQSDVDFLMPLRLLLYEAEILQDWLKGVPKRMRRRKGLRVPAVVPLVLYNGKQPWTAARRYREVVEGAQDFGVLIDVNRYGEEELLRLANAIGAAFYLDRPVEDTAELVERLRKVLELLKRMSVEEQARLVQWIRYVVVERLGKPEREAVAAAIEAAKEGEVGAMITNIERSIERIKRRLRAEGVAEGMAKGMAKGRVEEKRALAKKLLSRGMAVEEVAELTELSVDEVRRLMTDSGKMS
ncbi:MAG: hypothetical protein BLM47_11745 [Candidatus Reconcilbacillus cellulovorans]|uniref:Transposase (putative) YhgA-like domain-containing protein n=1 Tax=Candidatus Reconcilbacillus cellulovorans TaxID=1906605 RepID=A0A2A6DY05_9BACL|nr:MAG: hypothetical protein BLM47_11745 [Candidatus Reconcilbacillus cellulovorans]